MKKIYYEKIGRRYRPVAEYDRNLIDAMPNGTHLVMCYPGGQSTRYDIDPAHAPMIAAGRAAEFAMTDAIRRTGEIRPRTRTLTTEQREAWEHLIQVFGDDARIIEQASAREIAEAGIQALIQEADKLMKHESVRHAYEQFMLVCRLTKESRSA
jgi:hypothetical protein